MQGKKRNNIPAIDFLFWLAIIIILYVLSMRINTQSILFLGTH